MRVESVKAAYEKRPHTFNIGLTTLLGGASIAIAFYVGTMLENHSIDINAHPELTEQIQANGDQLNRIEANQVADRIEKLDARICVEPNNRELLRSMRELLAEYKKLSGEDFPEFLLKCANA